MKKSIMKYYLVVTLIGLCALSCLPIAFAKTNMRPIEDFFYNTFWVGGWGNPDYTVWTYYGVEDGEPVFIEMWNYEYSGYIKEKDLGDGIHSIEILIQGNDIPFVLTEDPYTGVLAYGTMDYLYKFEYNIDVEMWVYLMTNVYGLHPIGYDEKGDVILPYTGWTLWMPCFEPVRLQFVGQGGAEVIASFEDYLVGDDIFVKLTQVGLIKPDGAVWPVELTLFF